MHGCEGKIDDDDEDDDHDDNNNDDDDDDDDDDSSAAKQLRQEARQEAMSMASAASKEDATEAILTEATARPEPGPKFARTSTRNTTHDNVEESVGILSRNAPDKARWRQKPRQKLSAPTTANAARAKSKRKAEKEMYDVRNDEEEEEDATVSPRQSRRVDKNAHSEPTSHRTIQGNTVAARVPKRRRRSGQWTAFEDATLEDMLYNGDGFGQIREKLPHFTLDQIKDRATSLQEQSEAAATVVSTPKGLKGREKAHTMPHSERLPTPPQSGGPWSMEEEDHLVELWDAGTPELETAFPGRTRGSLTTRYYKVTREIKSGTRKPAKPMQDEPPRKRPKLQNAMGEPATAPELGEDEHALIIERGKAPRSGGRGNTPRNKKRQHVAPPKSDNGVRSGKGRTTRSNDVIVETPEEEERVEGRGGVEEDEQAPAQAEDEEEDGEGDFEDEAGGADVLESDIDIPPENVSFYGQSEALIKILKAAVEHETTTYKDEFSRRCKDELLAVKAIRINKDNIRNRYEELSTTNEIRHVRTAIDHALKKLDSQTRHLQLDTDEDDDGKRQLVHQVNLLVFTDLLSVLSAALKAHAGSALDDYKSKHWELECWVSIITSANNLYKKSRSEGWKKFKVPSVQKIRSNMTVPLAKVLQVFDREKKNLERSYDRRIQHAETLKASQRQRDSDDLEQQSGRKYNDMHRRLRYLFNWRRFYESTRYPSYPKFQMRAKSFQQWKEHTRPWDGATPELDSDGLPIERIAVFGERDPGRRPPASSVWDVEEEAEWTRGEKAALLEGLQKYQGMQLRPCSLIPL
jgi:hypothetical protein